MRRAKTIAAVLTLALGGSASQPVAAGGGEPTEATACAISAWLSTPDGDGVEVHAAPRADSAIVGQLPPPVVDEDYTFGAEVSVTGAKDGWFRIDRATVIDYIGDEEPKTVFVGEGWVPGAMLSLWVQSALLHVGPSADSPVAAELAGVDAEGYESGPDSFAVSGLDACLDGWVEVEGEFLGRRLRGWTAGTCANQVTTCS
jgi:hypothetical protein